MADEGAALQGDVILGIGVVHTILGSDTEAEVLAEEVHVLQTHLAAEAGAERAAVGGVEQGIHTCTNVEPDIIAMLVALCLHSGGEERGGNQDEYTFHILYYCLFIIF